MIRVQCDECDGCGEWCKLCGEIPDNCDCEYDPTGANMTDCPCCNGNGYTEEDEDEEDEEDEEDDEQGQ